MDGTGTTLTVFTAGTNGSYVTKIIARPAGTNVASVLRIFLNNGSTSATVANNALIGELSLFASTLNNAAALAPAEYPIGFAIPAGYKILVALGTTIAAGVVVSAICGDY